MNKLEKVNPEKWREASRLLIQSKLDYENKTLAESLNVHGVMPHTPQCLQLGTYCGGELIMLCGTVGKERHYAVDEGFFEGLAVAQEVST